MLRLNTESSHVDTATKSSSSIRPTTEPTQITAKSATTAASNFTFATKTYSDSLEISGKI